MIIEIIGIIICIWIIIIIISFLHEYFNFKKYSRKKQKEIVEKHIMNVLPMAVTFAIFSIIFKQIKDWIEKNIFGLPPRGKQQTLHNTKGK